MYLINKGGRLVDVEDTYKAEKMIKMYGARKATEQEIERYAEKVRLSQQNLDNPQPNTCFYQTVRSTPDGYGVSRDNLQMAMGRLGYTLLERDIGQKIGLLYNYPYSVTQMSNDVRLIYTMFESDKIPAEWPDLLRQADEVLVPSDWCAEVFAKSGIKATVIPLGYDSSLFTYKERNIPINDNQDFVFVHYNGFNIRKGFFELLEAFNKEFAASEPVKLIIKTTHAKAPIPIVPSQYPNVRIISGAVPTTELVDILSKAHCFVYPSRGEGFGLTPLEAMATGIPAIVPNAHGISHYFNPEYMLEVKVKEKSPALYNRFRGQDVGQMVTCDVDDLREKMRYAFNHQSLMRELGKKASIYAQNYTIDHTATELMKVINKWQGISVEKRQEAKQLFVERF